MRVPTRGPARLDCPPPTGRRQFHLGLEAVRAEGEKVVGSPAERDGPHLISSCPFDDLVEAVAANKARRWQSRKFLKIISLLAR